MSYSYKINAITGELDLVSVEDLSGYVPYSGATTDLDMGSNNVLVTDEVYGAGWNGSLEVPTKNAVYDKIETLSGGSPGGSDTQVQFNDGGAFAGANGFVWDKTTETLGIGIISPVAKVDVSQPNAGFSAILGADISADSRTNSTRKITRIGAPHYLSAEEPVSLLTADLQGTDNVLYIGGGTSQGNAATEIRLYTAPNNATTLGTLALYAGSNQRIGIGSSAPDRMLEINTGTSTDGIRLSYNTSGGTATYYADFLLTSSGALNLRAKGGVVINEAGFDENFRIEGDTDTNLFFLDAGLDRIGIGTATPAYKLDVAGTGQFTGALTIGAYTLPNTDGTNGQVLQTDGSGTASWQTPAGSGDMLKSVYDTDSNGVVDNSEKLNSQLPSYYLDRANHTGTQTASTISDFDTEVSNNTDVTANTAKVTESTTATLPLVLTGYDISIPVATALADGYLSSSDWSTFNSKQSALPVADTQTIVKGSVDATKLMRFEIDGLTTGTTRVLTVQDKDYTIADNADIPASTTDLPEGTNLYYTEVRVSANSDVTANTAKLTCDTTNVTNAGALMDSEVDADIKTLSLPANTTISVFGASLIDDADALTARTTLDVDQAGTDNSTDVTLDGSYDYITISGQVITRNQIDLTTDITGNLPVANLNNGTNASSATYWRGDGTWVTPGGSSPLTAKGDLYTYDTADARLPVGTDGYVLSADSSETTGLKWVASTGSPGGADTQIQFNNSGAFGASSDFTWDDTGKVLTTNGRFVLGSTGYSLFIGSDAGLNDDGSSNYNIAIGEIALKTNTSGDNCIAIGYNALNANTTGARNIAIGVNALMDNQSTYQNVAIGTNTLQHNKTNFSTIVGDYAAITGTNIKWCAGLGQYVLYRGTDAYHDVAIGQYSLGFVTSGDHNVGVGGNSGLNLTTGSYNIFIGKDSGYDSSQKVDAENSMALGYETYTTASNQFVYGNGSVTQHKFQAGQVEIDGTAKYANASTATVAANGTSVSVTFPQAFASGVTPVVVATPEYQTSVWITSITNTGCTINVGTTSGYDETINYIAMA